jgi:hypothetical protein
MALRFISKHGDNAVLFPPLDVVRINTTVRQYMDNTEPEAYQIKTYTIVGSRTKQVTVHSMDRIAAVVYINVIAQAENAMPACTRSRHIVIFRWPWPTAFVLESISKY